jgi:hypothetical protein
VEQVFNTHLVASGFRILGVSQRLFRQEIIDPPGPATAYGGTEIFTYARGQDATIVAFGFAFPQALRIHAAVTEAGARASLFSVNAMLPSTWEPILNDLRRTQRLAVVDDSKSANRASDRLMIEAAKVCAPESIATFARPFAEDWYRPNPDLMDIDPGAVLERLGIGARRLQPAAPGEKLVGSRGRR